MVRGSSSGQSAFALLVGATLDHLFVMLGHAFARLFRRALRGLGVGVVRAGFDLRVSFFLGAGCT